MELKPCPFCGGEAISDREDVFCKDCGANIKVYPQTNEDGIWQTWAEARKNAEEAWNRRVDNGKT